MWAIITTSSFCGCFVFLNVVLGIKLKSSHVKGSTLLTEQFETSFLEGGFSYSDRTVLRITASRLPLCGLYGMRGPPLIQCILRALSVLDTKK